MVDITILHGPNLNLTGLREPSIYGDLTLAQINEKLTYLANPLSVDCRQSNSEAELIDWVQQINSRYIIINPAAFTHSSIALRDAFLAVKTPFVEVHMSNIYSRESFRHKSYLADIAAGIISGFGWESYVLALHYVRNQLLKQ